MRVRVRAAPRKPIFRGRLAVVLFEHTGCFTGASFDARGDFRASRVPDVPEKGPQMLQWLHLVGNVIYIVVLVFQVAGTEVLLTYTL